MLYGRCEVRIIWLLSALANPMGRTATRVRLESTMPLYEYVCDEPDGGTSVIELLRSAKDADAPVPDPDGKGRVFRRRLSVMSVGGGGGGSGGGGSPGAGGAGGHVHTGSCGCGKPRGGCGM